MQSLIFKIKITLMNILLNTKCKYVNSAQVRLINSLFSIKIHVLAFKVWITSFLDTKFEQKTISETMSKHQTKVTKFTPYVKVFWISYNTAH